MTKDRYIYLKFAFLIILGFLMIIVFKTYYQIFDFKMIIILSISYLVFSIGIIINQKIAFVGYLISLLTILFYREIGIKSIIFLFFSQNIYIFL